MFAFSLSFFTDPHLRRNLAALGLSPRFGLPGQGDWVLVWGCKPVAQRGRVIARWRGAKVVTAEDGFLRSVRTGREGEPGFSFVLDDLGVYFETSRASRLQVHMDQVAATGPSAGAASHLDRWCRSGLSKYNVAEELSVDLPDRFVLVVDQTRGDASIPGAGASDVTFKAMLAAAKADHPDKTMVVKTHPETAAGHRGGHFSSGEADILYDRPARPVDLLARAEAVYCVSSLFGLEAILHGHKPVVFGDAFYAGRGLTEDRHARTQPKAALTREALFDATYLRYARYVDRARGVEIEFDGALDALSDLTRAFRVTGKPLVMAGMRLWKRGFLRRMFPALKKFDDAPSGAQDVAVWAGKVTPQILSACADHGTECYRMEDGFIRSRGLGAELVVPASVTLDDCGIYYDPSGPSRLEQLIAASTDLPETALSRAARLRAQVIETGISKYNLDGHAPSIGAAEGQEIVLVPGQVEDDQSILKGTSSVRTNTALLQAARQAFPKAWILYKPHPDVLAGLRDGGQKGADHADQVIENADISELLGRVDRVATMTSLTGFEALIRGIPVTVFGQPFYAGWSLTEDRVRQSERRKEPISLDGLVHAALIDYPYYWDPATGLPCGPETVVARLAERAPDRRSRRLRFLAKAQGLAASYAHLWR